PEEVVVQRGDLEAVVERGTHRGVHLILGDHHVTHHHGVRAPTAEGCPGSETERRRELHAGCSRADIVARIRYFERAFLLVELTLEPGELLDLRSVQLGGRLRSQ